MITYYLTGLSAWLTAMRSDTLRKRADTGPPEKRRTHLVRSRFWAIVCGLILIAVGALRWRVGTDYPTYAQTYPEWRDKPLREYGLLDEPGLAVITKIGRIFHDDYAVMLGLASVFTIWLFVRTIYRNSDMFAFSIALFMLTGPWLGSFNGVRQYLACAVIFAGHRLILERKFLKYALVVGLAGLFHVSAFVTILFYFVPRRRLSVLSSGLVIAAALLVAESYGRILNIAMTLRPDSDFTTAYVTESIDPLRIVVAFAPVALYLLVTEKSRLSSEDHFYIQLIFINAAVFVAVYGSAYIARFTAFTLMFLCLALPRLMPRDETGRLRATVIFTTLILYFIFWFVETSGSPGLAQFRWIFNRDSSLSL